MHNCTKAAFKSLTVQPVLLKTTHLILWHDQIINNCHNIPTVAAAFIFVIHVSILGQLVNLLYAAFLLPVLYTGSKKAVFKTIVISSSILQYIVCRENSDLSPCTLYFYIVVVVVSVYVLIVALLLLKKEWSERAITTYWGSDIVYY